MFWGSVRAQDNQPRPLDMIGPSEGTFVATSNGAATFRIPIFAPPGRAGIEPALEVVYNSRTRDTLLGRGWALDGLPSIVRCGATKAQDGFAGTVRFDANDRFCINGQRLVVVSGGYGSDGSEYRTEIDDFVRFVSYGVAGSGPALFRAWMKSGRMLEFGGTADSRIEAPGKPSAYAWALNRVVDTSQNYMTVMYTENSDDGEFRPLRVDYTGNGSETLPTRRIDFQYAPRIQPSITYLGGSRIRLTSRLSRITSSADGALARQYNFAYFHVPPPPCGAPPPGGGSPCPPGRDTDQLISIEECGDGLCLPKWGFGQTPTSIGLSQIAALSAAMWWRESVCNSYVADVNGDGLLDVVQVKLATNEARVLLGTPSGDFVLQWTSPTTNVDGFVRSGNSYTTVLGDIDGDGKADIVQIAKTSVGGFVLLSNGDGTFRSAWTMPSSGDGAPIASAGVVWLRDVNADGRADLVMIHSVNHQTRTLLSRGDGTFTTAWNSPPLEANQGFTYSASTAFSHLGDVNGDGIPDLIQIRTSVSLGRVSFGVGDGSFVTGWISPSSPTAEGWIRSYNGTQTHFADFNGDGLVDIIQIYTTADQAFVYLSKGDGSFTSGIPTPTDPSASGFLQSGNDCLTLTGDIDGDGKVDLIQISKAQNQAQLFISRGDGSFLTAGPVVTGIVSNANSVENLFHDFGGVGSARLMQIFINADTGHRVVKTGDGSDGLLGYVTTPLSRRIDIGWGFITDPGVHTRGAGSVYPTIDRPGRGEAVVRSTRSTTGFDPNEYTDILYTYGGMKYDLLGRGSLGFLSQTMSEQAPGGVSIKTSFQQLFPATGAIQAIETFNQAGALVASTSHHWTHVPSVPPLATPYFRRLDQTDNQDCFGGAGCRHIGQLFPVYDEYGNRKVVYSEGDLSLGFDDREERTDWAVDVATWLHRPSHITVYGPGQDLLRERWILYDDLPLGQLGARGLPTRIESRLKGGLFTAGNAVITRAYDSAFGNLQSETDTRGCVTTIEQYDLTHQTFPETVAKCLSHTRRFTFDARWGKLSTARDENGQLTTHQYDPVGRLVKIMGPLDTASLYGSVAFEYLALGTPSQRVITRRTEQHGTANARWTEEYFDKLGRVRRVLREGPAGEVIETTTAYDARGLVSSVSVPHFTTESVPLITFSYDDLGRVKKTVKPDGTFVKTDYLGARRTVTDERGKVKHYDLDGFDRVIRVEEVNDEESYQTIYTYDGAGALVRMENQQGAIHATVFDRDYLGRPFQIVDPNSGHWSFDFDASGDLKSQTDAKGQTLSWEYDLHGRPTKKKDPNLTLVQWEYDDRTVPYSIGRLTKVSDGAAITSFRYDELGIDQLGVVTQTQRVLDGVTYTSSHRYDAFGRPTRVVFPDSDTVDYTFNPAGGIATVRDGISGAVYISAIDYNARGQRKRVQFSNGVTSTLTYFDDTAPTFYLKTVVSVGPSGELQNLAYEYDPAGNVRDIADATPGGTASRHYEYDALNRLKSASGTFDGSPELYRYDGVGNFFEKAGVVYTYSDPLHPSAVTGRTDGLTYWYDDNGNMRRVEPGRTYEWDVENRLRAVIPDSGPAVTFAYDYTGERLKKTVTGGGTVRYPLPGYEVGEDGTISKYFAGVRKRSDGTVVFFQNDHLEGVYIITDDGGALRQRTEYGPWGEVVREDGVVELTRGFTGQHIDSETSLMYYGARYYDAVLGRFISPDPIVGDIDDPQSWNPYSYVVNRPTLLTDPTGMFGCGVSGWALLPSQQRPDQGLYDRTAQSLGDIVAPQPFKRWSPVDIAKEQAYGDAARVARNPEPTASSFPLVDRINSAHSFQQATDLAGALQHGGGARSISSDVSRGEPTPFTFGGTFGFSGFAGLGFGVAGTFSGSGGLAFGRDSINAGGAVTGGGIIGGFGKGFAVPEGRATGFVLGLAGSKLGPGFFLSNANAFADFKGTATTTTLAIGVVGVQIDKSGGTFAISLSPALGVGVAQFKTVTPATGDRVIVGPLDSSQAPRSQSSQSRPLSRRAN